MRESALDFITGQVEGDLFIVNPMSFARHDLAFWPRGADGLQRADGAPVLVQSTADGTWIDAGELAPYSVTPLITRGAGDSSLVHRLSLVASSTLLENDLLRVELNEVGDITRIYDKINKRQVLPTGALANQFQAFEDRPMQWDAWDLHLLR